MPKPILFEPVENPYLVPFDGNFKLSKMDTRPDEKISKKDNVRALEEQVEKLAKLQAKLYAQNSYSVILIFQALDAAGSPRRC